MKGIKSDEIRSRLELFDENGNVIQRVGNYDLSMEGGIMSLIEKEGRVGDLMDPTNNPHPIIQSQYD